MKDHVAKTVEIVGSSRDSLEKAVRNALQTASESLRNLRWFEVTEIRGTMEDNANPFWQVTVKIGFTVEESISD